MCDTQENNLPYNRVATVRKKCLENETFSGQGKIRELCGWSGKFRKALKSRVKVREFENKWMWQADLRKFILFKREKDVLSHEIV